MSSTEVDIVCFQGKAYRENTIREQIITAQTILQRCWQQGNFFLPQQHHSSVLYETYHNAHPIVRSLRKKRLTQHQVNNP